MLEGLITGVILTTIILVIINGIVINDLTHRIEDLEANDKLDHKTQQCQSAESLRKDTKSIIEMKDKEFEDFCIAFECKLKELTKHIPELEELTKDIDAKFRN